MWEKARPEVRGGLAGSLTGVAVWAWLYRGHCDAATAYAEQPLRRERQVFKYRPGINQVRGQPNGEGLNPSGRLGVDLDYLAGPPHDEVSPPTANTGRAWQRRELSGRPARADVSPANGDIPWPLMMSGYRIIGEDCPEDVCALITHKVKGKRKRRVPRTLCEFIYHPQPVVNPGDAERMRAS
jgi:hypothetical protein